MANPKFSVNVIVSERGRNKPNYDVNSDLNGEMTLKDLLDFTRGVLIVTADEVLKEEQERGFDENPILLVDGRRGKSIKTVHPLGKIEFVSRQSFGKILLDAYEGLLHRSKVLTGQYIKSHYVFLNGTQVATDMTSLQSWLSTDPEFKEKDVLRIVNIQPYARRLERLGVTAQRSSPRRTKSGPSPQGANSFVAPNGAYQLTARSIKSKYKQNALIRFTFLPGTSLGLSGSFKGGRKGRNSAGRPYLYPTLVFTVQERGIL